MKIKQGLHIAEKVINFRLTHMGVTPAAAPINFTFSVTNKCQSRCLSCKIWEVYRKEPEKLQEELSLDEIEKMFRSVGNVYFFNVSGGCPFLRNDLPEIVELGCRYLRPSVIHIPTNALAVEKTIVSVKKILAMLDARFPNIALQIKPSFDGVGSMHDEVRGVKGNFDKLLRLVAGLKELQKGRTNLHVGLGTVVSRFNIKHLREIMDYADKLDVDSYISEVAENRDEMFNTEDNIAPSPDEFKIAMREFKTAIHSRLSRKKGLARITDAFRLVYYDLTADILNRKKQVIPCYGGISNVHVDPYGNVWPCCILGNTQSMGNLKDTQFRFWDIWRSERAAEVRKFIKQKKCHCPLANQSYANILCDFRKLAQVLLHLLPFKVNGARGTH
ncbi:MAG: radical SAM/SPASM domain-containing protein [Nitrospinales bacterium]